MNDHALNEEEVKVKILLPWLRSLGVSEADLSFETSFRIKFNKRLLEIGSNAAPETVRARLDILVRRGTRNLVVIEAKRQSATLTDEDRDQALLYAKLLQPIAPLALVTNGDEFRLFDTISGERIEPDSTRFADGYSVSLPDGLRAEALRLFVTRSPANLAVYCANQVAQETRLLHGDVKDFGAVYIPVAHVHRDELLEMVQPFLASSKTVFATVGESGMGKTCGLVDISGALAAAGYPSLFFRAALLQASILDEVVSEFAWAFGSSPDPMAAVRSLTEHAEGRPLVIIVDGLEDWSFEKRVQHLSSLAAHLHPKHTRLIVSCKASAWEKFLDIRGQTTSVERAIFGADASKRYTIEVGPFTAAEFVKAVETYRDAFGVHKGFETGAFEQAKQNPFLLRLLFQVAAQTDAAYLGFDSARFFDEYLRLAVRRTSDPIRAARVLAKAAALLYEHDAEAVDEAELLSAANVNDSILSELFELRLLVRGGDLLAPHVSFGFGQLRNYITAFQVRRWTGFSGSAFAEELSGGRTSSVRSEVVAFYYPFAPAAHKREIAGSLEDNAREYLRQYVEIIDRDFPAFRDRFSPFTRGAIGFVGELFVRQGAIGAHGFRQLQDGADDVLLVPAREVFGSNKLRLSGADGAGYSTQSRYFRSPDQTAAVVLSNVVPQLREIMKLGVLNESETPELPKELVLSTIAANRRVFGQLVENPSNPRARLPVRLDDIKTELRREMLRQHFHYELEQAKLRRGAIASKWRGSVRSYTVNFTPSEYAGIDSRVRAALENNEHIEFRVEEQSFGRMKERLMLAIEDLAGTSDVIDACVTPYRTEVLAKLSVREDAYPTFRDHCRQLIRLVLATYRHLIEVNFPTLKRHFNTYQRLPSQVVLGLPRNVFEDDRRARLYFCRSSSATSEAFVFETEELQLDDHDDTRILKTPDGPLECQTWRTTSAGLLLYGRPHTGLECDYDGAVLRRWVYGWLNDEMEAVEAAFRLATGVVD